MLRKTLPRSLSLVFPLLLLLFTHGACRSKSSGSEADTESVVLAGRVWSNPEAIPLCLVNAEEVDPALITDLKNHANNDFSTKAGMTFTGWEPCTQADFSSEVIRLRLRRVHDWSSRMQTTGGGGLSMVGPSVRGCPGCNGATMQVDIGRDGRYPDAGHPMLNFILAQSRGTMVHELGHAVGLLHEHERTDGPGCGDFEKSAPENRAAGVVYVGRYDPDSIMNYCHDNRISTLSSGDAAGLGFLYPSVTKNPREPLRPNPRPAPPKPRPNDPPEVPKKPQDPVSPPAPGPDLSSPCEPRAAPESRIGKTENSGFVRLVFFRNSCAQPLTVYWMNYEGQPVSYGTIRPGGVLLLKTYQEHAWQFRNAQTGTLLKEFRIAPWMRLVQVP